MSELNNDSSSASPSDLQEVTLTPVTKTNSKKPQGMKILLGNVLDISPSGRGMRKMRTNSHSLSHSSSSGLETSDEEGCQSPSRSPSLSYNDREGTSSRPSSLARVVGELSRQRRSSPRLQHQPPSSSSLSITPSGTTRREQLLNEEKKGIKSLGSPLPPYSPPPSSRSNSPHSPSFKYLSRTQSGSPSPSKASRRNSSSSSSSSSSTNSPSLSSRSSKHIDRTSAANGVNSEKSKTKKKKQKETDALAVNIVFLGEASVGKTSLILRYTTSEAHSHNNIKMTVGVDVLQRQCIVSGYNVCVRVWDTAGTERHRTIMSSLYKNAHAIGIVYDISDRDSFLFAQGWINDSEDMTGCPKVLIGNKADCMKDRVVSYVEGEQLATSHGLSFFETSAVSNKNVDNVFSSLVSTVLEEGIDSHRRSGISLRDGEKEKEGNGDGKGKKKKSKCCS